MHAASVGEVITVLPLIEKMQLLNPALRFQVSTNTPTGLAVLEDRLPGYATYSYLPLDFSGATKRYFARKNISSLWVVETEIWPWLFARTKQYNIPTTLVNARLSYKSNSKLANFFSRTYTHALTDVVVLARSDKDATRFANRGANLNNISVIGNLKYAATKKIQTPSRLLSRNYVLAASTHDNEELQLAQAWLHASVDGLLVIVPRHPGRGKRLRKTLNALQHEINPDLPDLAVRSAGEQPSDNGRLYLADTLGEMDNWYAYASAAFVGGSLIRRGGHNVLEPGRVATPIIVGPHTFNFSEEVALLHSVQAIAKAENVDEVIQLLALGVSDKQWARNMGDRAKTVITAQGEVLDKYIASLSRVAESSSVADNLQG